MHPWQLLANPAYEPDALGQVPYDDVAEDDGVTPDGPDLPAQPGDLDPTLRYSTDITDAELEKRFLEDMGSLGSM
jgi:hypothetical protein